MYCLSVAFGASGQGLNQDLSTSMAHAAPDLEHMHHRFCHNYDVDLTTTERAIFIFQCHALIE